MKNEIYEIPTPKRHYICNKINLVVKNDFMERIMKRKLMIFGHICTIMDDNREIKNVMLGIMDGKNRRGRRNREWIDDIKEWCRKDIII